MGRLNRFAPVSGAPSSLIGVASMYFMFGGGVIALFALLPPIIVPEVRAGYTPFELAISILLSLAVAAGMFWTGTLLADHSRGGLVRPWIRPALIDHFLRHFLFDLRGIESDRARHDLEGSEMTASARRRICLLVPMVLLAFTGPTAEAQSSSAARLGVHQLASLEMPAPSRSLEYSTMPRWVKWGLIGAAAGAVTFGLFSRMTIEDDNPLLPDVALGAAVGFVTIGGAVAFYDWVCKPDSSSDRAGLC